jgi:hypothetical protein
MKKLTMCLVLSVASYGQTGMTHRSFTWHSTRLPLTPDAGTLRVDLRALPSRTIWYLGANVDPEKNDEVAVSEMRMEPRNYFGVALPGLKGLDEIPASSLMLSNGAIVVSPALEAGSALLVYLTLSGPRHVVVETSDGVAVQATITSSVILGNGALISTPLQGQPDLIALAGTSAGAIAESPMLFEYGKVFVALPLLKSHLVSYSEPAGVSSPPAQNVMVLLTLNIDERGQVVKTWASSDSQPAAAAAQQAAAHWTFEPFLRNGEAIPVVASLPIVIGTDGRLSTPFKLP